MQAATDRRQTCCKDVTEESPPTLQTSRNDPELQRKERSCWESKVSPTLTGTFILMVALNFNHQFSMRKLQTRPPPPPRQNLLYRFPAIGLLILLGPARNSSQEKRPRPFPTFTLWATPNELSAVVAASSVIYGVQPPHPPPEGAGAASRSAAR